MAELRRRVKHRRRRFQTCWYENDSSLKLWLRRVPADDTKFCCRICKKVGICGISKIFRHSITNAHLNNMRLFFTPSINPPRLYVSLASPLVTATFSTALSLTNPPSLVPLSSTPVFSSSSSLVSSLLTTSRTVLSLSSPPPLVSLSSASATSSSSLQSPLRLPLLSPLPSVPSSSSSCVTTSSSSSVTVISKSLTHVPSLMTQTTPVNSAPIPKTSVSLTCSSMSIKDLSFADRVKVAEIRVAAFIAENNLPFSICSQMVHLFQDFVKEASVLKFIKLSGSKCSAIINNVLHTYETERIVDNLRNLKFSIYKNENFDSTNRKWLTILAKYIDSTTLSTKSQLLHMIELGASGCSHFASFCNELSKKQIPISNILALAYNNTANKSDGKSSFATELSEKNSNIVLLSCVCYSSALVANAACSCLPSECDELIGGLINFINTCPKHPVFRDLQTRLQEESLKAVKQGNSKWLARQLCISRFVNNIDAIRVFLQEIAVSDETGSAEKYLTLLNRVDMEAYLLFLDYVLNPINSYNTMFQSKDTLVHKLQPKSKELLLFFLQKFLSPELVGSHSVRSIDLALSENHLSLKTISLGSKCDNFLKDNDVLNSELSAIRTNCLQFYISAATQIRNLLPFDNDLYSKITSFDANVAMYASDRNTTFKDVFDVANTLSVNVDKNDLKNEWESLYYLSPKVKLDWFKLSFDDMWSAICSKTSPSGDNKFPELRKLLFSVRSLPHSNIQGEMICSVLHDIKSQKRYSMKSKAMNSICVIRTAFKARGVNCRSFEVTRRHLDLMNSDNLYVSANVSDIISA